MYERNEGTEAGLNKSKVNEGYERNEGGSGTDEEIEGKRRGGMRGGGGMN
jgi:hypothetical protein